MRRRSPDVSIQPLYFVYSGPPPDANVLVRLLIGIVALAFLVVFVTAFRELVKRVSPAYEWAGSMAFAAGLVHATITLVSNGLEAGAVIATDHRIDPTIDVNGTYILYGSISRLLLALFLTAVGYIVARTKLLPRWATSSPARSCYRAGPAGRRTSWQGSTWLSYRPCSSAAPPRTSTRRTAGAPPP